MKWTLRITSHKHVVYGELIRLRLVHLGVFGRGYLSPLANVIVLSGDEANVPFIETGADMSKFRSPFIAVLGLGLLATDCGHHDPISHRSPHR